MFMQIHNRMKKKNWEDGAVFSQLFALIHVGLFRFIVISLELLTPIQLKSFLAVFFYFMSFMVRRFPPSSYVSCVHCQAQMLSSGSSITLRDSATAVKPGNTPATCWKPASFDILSTRSPSPSSVTTSLEISVTVRTVSREEPLGSLGIIQLLTNEKEKKRRKKEHRGQYPHLLVLLSHPDMANLSLNDNDGSSGASDQDTLAPLPLPGASPWPMMHTFPYQPYPTHAFSSQPPPYHELTSYSYAPGSTGSQHSEGEWCSITALVTCSWLQRVFSKTSRCVCLLCSISNVQMLAFQISSASVLRKVCIAFSYWQ